MLCGSRLHFLHLLDLVLSVTCHTLLIVNTESEVDRLLELGVEGSLAVEVQTG